MSTERIAASVLQRLKGKVAVITGGSGGIGEATVRLFANHGANVIIADIADEAGEKVAESLSRRAIYIHCDVSKEKDVSEAVDLAMEKHGSLDIMFNNAGIINTKKGSVAEYDMEDYERVMNINAKGVMHGIKHAARVMIPNRKGSIVSTASIAGVLGGCATYSYTASKHAVIGLTKNGAVELGKYGIRVNCISPSGVPTDLLTGYFGRVLSEEEKTQRAASRYSGANLKETTLGVDDIAEAALYLAGEESKYVSGQNIVVDGGITITNNDWAVYR